MGRIIRNLIINCVFKFIIQETWCLSVPITPNVACSDFTLSIDHVSVSNSFLMEKHQT